MKYGKTAVMAIASLIAVATLAVGGVAAVEPTENESAVEINDTNLSNADSVEITVDPADLNTSDYAVDEDADGNTVIELHTANDSLSAPIDTSGDGDIVVDVTNASGWSTFADAHTDGETIYTADAVSKVVIDGEIVHSDSLIALPPTADDTDRSLWIVIGTLAVGYVLLRLRD